MWFSCVQLSVVLKNFFSSLDILQQESSGKGLAFQNWNFCTERRMTEWKKYEKVPPRHFIKHFWHIFKTWRQPVIFSTFLPCQKRRKLPLVRCLKITEKVSFYNNKVNATFLVTFKQCDLDMMKKSSSRFQLRLILIHYAKTD